MILRHVIVVSGHMVNMKFSGPGPQVKSNLFKVAIATSVKIWAISTRRDQLPGLWSNRSSQIFRACPFSWDSVLVPASSCKLEPNFTCSHLARNGLCTTNAVDSKSARTGHCVDKIRGDARGDWDVASSRRRPAYSR